MLTSVGTPDYAPGLPAIGAPGYALGLRPSGTLLVRGRLGLFRIKRCWVADDALHWRKHTAPGGHTKTESA